MEYPHRVTYYNANSIILACEFDNAGACPPYFHLLLKHIITRLFFNIPSLSVTSPGQDKDQASGNCNSGLRIIPYKGFSHTY